MPRWLSRKAVDGEARGAGPSGGRVASEQVQEAIELQFLLGVRQGRHGDFESLYRIYHPRLQRFLVHLVRRPELVDEVRDDTMMVVWQRAQSFDGRSKLSTWIFGIAYRQSMKALGRLDLPVEDLETDVMIEPGCNPEQQLGLLQMQGQLQQALSELSADHRAVVDLCYFHGMAYGEIAAVVGCPQETVKTRMFYARRRLKQLLAGVIDGPHGEES